MLPSTSYTKGKIRSNKDVLEENESQLVAYNTITKRFGSVLGTRYLQNLPKAKRPRAYLVDRICQFDECEVRLSAYNKGPNCYQHSPYRYPRVRGIPQ